MNANYFLTKADYDYIISCVDNKTDFEFEKQHKKLTLDIHSSYAKVEFSKYTKENDYIVGVGYTNFTKDYMGGGCAYCPIKFKEMFKTYNTALNFIDSLFGNISDYEKQDNTNIQLNFLEVV